jgi:uncharacterized spore protein YtfJ
MTGAEDEARQAAENDHGSRILERLVSQVGGHARVQAVFGDPVERDGVTVVPVARVRWGVGGGGGSGTEGMGSGGGGGVTADPIGYIEITTAGATFQRVGRTVAAGDIIAAAIAAAIVVRALARFRR